MFNRSMRRSVVAIGIAQLLAIPAIARGQDSIPLRLEVTTPRRTCRLFENVPIVIRVTNPNAFDVELQAVTVEAWVPTLEALRDAEWVPVRTVAETSPTRKAIPRALKAGATVELQRLVHGELVDFDRWPAETGVTRLRARCAVSRGRRAGDGNFVSIAWTSTDTTLEVLPLRNEDREVVGFLNSGKRRVREGEGDAVLVNSVELLREVLSRYPASPYSDEIHVNLVNELGLLLGNRVRSLDQPTKARYLDAYETSVLHCTELGRPYCEDVIEWDWSRGGSVCMEIALNNRRESLMRAVSAAMDRYRGDDSPTRMYRAALLAIVRGDGAEARRIRDDLQRDYPDHRATEAIADIAP